MIESVFCTVESEGMRIKKSVLSNRVSHKLIAGLFRMCCCIFLVGMVGCGWLKPVADDVAMEAHEHGPGCDHGLEGHADHDNDHRMYGGWDTTEFPSAANLYRSMHLIDGLKDTSDKGFPSQAEMFVATFSDEYLRYKPDSAALQTLRLALRQSGLEVRFSGAAWDDASKQYLPRLARVLDLVRFDSAQLHYRSRSLDGRWIHEGLHNTQWANDSVFPSVQLSPKGKASCYRSGAALLRPERYLLDCLIP
jgi:hypothetical protein